MAAQWNRSGHVLIAICTVVALAATTTIQARAATGFWTGAVDGIWANPANWFPSPAPGNGETATFDGSGNGNTTIDLGTGITVGAIQFDGFTAPYTIGSGLIGSQSLTLNDVGFIDMSPSTQSGQVFNSTILLGSATAASYTLSNSSTFGTLTFNGTVQGGTGGAAGAKTLTVSGGGATAIAGLLSNGGASSLALSMGGSGTLTFSGTSLATGTTSANAGTLNLGGVLAGGGAVSVGSGGTLWQSSTSLIGVNNATTLTVNGAATLAGSNQYTGATTVNNGGVLTIRSGLALGTTGAGTTINAGGELQVQGSIYTLAEALSLNGSGPAGQGGLRNVSGINTYLGAITLAGAARIGADAGRLNLGNTVTNGGNLLTVGGAGDVTSSFAISGTGGLTKDGTGALAMYGASTYAGATSISQGTLTLGSVQTGTTSGPLGTNGSIAFGGGTLQYSPQNNFDYSGRFSSAPDQAIRVDTNSRDVTFAAPLTSSGGTLAKSGPGTLTLGSVNNLYSGGTTVSGGTLLVTGSLPGGTTTVASGGSLSMVNGSATGQLLPDTLSLGGGANLAFDWSGTAADQLYPYQVSASGVIGITLATSGTPAGSPTLINAPAGGLTTGGATYYLANATTFTAALAVDDMTLGVSSYAAATPLTSAYWIGNTLANANAPGIDNAMALSNGVTSNWSAAATYAATPLVPGATTDVFFAPVSGAASSQRSNVVLGSSMSVKSLTFNDTTPVTIANDGSFLQINSTGTGVSSAISVNQDATINAGIVLGANQTWTTSAGRTLTVGGTIGNVNAGAGLTIAGPGTTRITGTAAYSGATTVNNGATLELVAGSRKTYLGSGSTFSVSGVANVSGDLDVHTLTNLNGVINAVSGGFVTVRGAAGSQDVAVNIGGGGYGALTLASGSTVTVLDGGSAGGFGSMNIQNGGTQGLLRISGGTLNVGTIMTARNGGGTSEITITNGLLFKPGGTFNLGDRGGFTTVLNVAGGLVDNTGQTLSWGRGGGTAGASQIVTNFNAGTILTREFAVSGQANFQVVTNYNGGTLKVSPGVNANFYNGTAPATTSITAFVNGAAAFAGNPTGQQFGGGVVVDTNGSSTNLNVNLLAPTGNGITSLSLASSGSGYTGPPTITITDAGVTRTGTTAFSTTIAMADTSSVFVGQAVSGTGITAGSIVTAVNPNLSVTISQPATTAAATALQFRGVGATAYATVSGGSVTGVVLTNPGVGYVGSVTAALGGGFGTGGTGTPATFNAITPAANSSGGVTKNGVGTLTLSGVNTFTGPIAVNSGTLAFGASVTTSYANPISGVGSIAQTGTGTTILTGVGTYLGSTTISSGVLRLDSPTALPGGIGATGGTSALTFSGGVLGLGYGDYSRPLAATGTVTAATFTGAGGWAAYGADRAVNIGGFATPATVTWGTADTGLNAQTLILGNVTATHTVDVRNPLDLGTAVRTVQVDNGAASADGRLGAALLGTGGVTKTGSGTLVLGSTANAYTGATTISAGTLLSSTSGVIPDTSAVTVSGNAANVRAILDVNGRNETIGSLTLGGSTATSAATVATGAGTLTLGGDVTYSNGGNPLAATIQGNLALGAASRTFTVNDSATVAYDLAVQAAITGTGVGLTKSGTGTLLLTGANTYTGLTTVSAGTLTVGTRSALANDTPINWTPTNIAVNSGATLALGVGSGGAGYFTAADIDTLLDASHLGSSTATTGLKTGSVIGFDTTTASGSTFTYTSVISNPGSAATVGVAKLGPGTLTLGGNNTYTGTTTVSQGTLILTGTNVGAGTVTVAGGVLRANQGVGLNSGSLLTLSGGVLETGSNLERSGGSVAGTMQITGGASGFSAAANPVQVAFGTLASPTALTWGTAPFAPGTLLLNAATATNTLDFKNAVNLGTSGRTVQVDANVATMSGIVSNGSTGGTLTKTGNGTLVLSGNNTYNAATTVSAGTLVLSGTNASAGTYSIQSGGTLRLNGASGSIPATAPVFFGVNSGTFAGGGTFVYDNAGATGATSQTLVTLGSQISQPDDHTVRVVRTAAQPVSLIVTTLSSNSSENGNVINFVTTDAAGGGVNGTDYKIVLGNQTTGLKITNQNAYYNGGDFAVYQGSGLTGYVRGIAYGTDANTATSAGGASFATPGALTSQEITGTITAQPATTLASGTLNGSLKIVGASDLTMQLNASLTINGSGNSGTGGILKTGGGTSTISGGAGTTGFVNLTNTQGNIRVDGATDVLTIAMPVTWGAATRLLKSGAGTLIFSSGTLPFTDTRNTMYINGGVFQIGGNAVYNGSAANQLNLASGTLFRYSSSSNVSFRAGTIAGLGGVEVTAGALALTNTGNSYLGPTTLSGGILNVAALANGGTASSIGQSANAAANLVIAGGTLQYTGAAAAVTDRLFTLGSAATLDASGTTPAAVVNFSNTGAMAFGSAGGRTLTLTGSNTGANTLAVAIGENAGATSIVKTGPGSWTLSGANTYSGSTTVSAGTLEVAVGAAIGDSSAVSIANVAGARLLVSSNETIGSLAGGGNVGGEVALGFNTLTVGDATSTVFAGTMSGSAGSLVKRGTGTLALRGTNTYGGPTSVAAGTLLVNGTLGAGTLSVAVGATLGGSGLVGGATTIAGTHVPGNSAGLQTFTGGLAYGSTATLVWELSANTAALSDRGSLYDGIDLTTAGLLAIDPAAAISLVFDAPSATATPSTVDWNDAFWAVDRQWLLGAVQAPVTWNGTLFGQVLVGNDSLGQSLAARRPGSSFAVAQGLADGNLYVTYAAPVPEPGTLAGLAVALGICSWIIRRDRRGPRC